jgi:hypothetical protein
MAVNKIPQRARRSNCWAFSLLRFIRKNGNIQATQPIAKT